MILPAKTFFLEILSGFQDIGLNKAVLSQDSTFLCWDIDRTFSLREDQAHYQDRRSQPESSARTSDCPSARSGTAGESSDVISRDGLSQKRRKAFTAVGKAGVSDPGAKPPPCPGSPRALAGHALHPWPLLLNTAGCPDVRDGALGEVPVQMTPTACVYHLPCRTVKSLDSSKSPMGAQTLVILYTFVTGYELLRAGLALLQQLRDVLVSTLQGRTPIRCVNEALLCESAAEDDYSAGCAWGCWHLTVRCSLLNSWLRYWCFRLTAVMAAATCLIGHIYLASKSLSALKALGNCWSCTVLCTSPSRLLAVDKEKKTTTESNPLQAPSERVPSKAETEDKFVSQQQTEELEQDFVLQTATQLNFMRGKPEKSHTCEHGQAMLPKSSFLVSDGWANQPKPLAFKSAGLAVGCPQAGEPEQSPRAFLVTQSSPRDSLAGVCLLVVLRHKNLLCLMVTEHAACFQSDQHRKKKPPACHISVVPCAVSLKTCENSMCKQLAGLNCLPMAFGLLKVRDHPEVLSRDGVKQLYFEMEMLNVWPTDEKVKERSTGGNHHLLLPAF
ncbi:hypothetical protein Anapl_01508 [Anas platyrhynchos]|uniref:Uncharacterized protein n=1 Tax=Anas platyrhynchos TaxID=8839 RepID=R0LRC9_ANAPL|nr:hypothetical protein Anapl_01508 [Anas platyrhynchos]